jgi:hypothetical protein
VSDVAGLQMLSSLYSLVPSCCKPSQPFYQATRCFYRGYKSIRPRDIAPRIFPIILTYITQNLFHVNPRLGAASLVDLKFQTFSFQICNKSVAIANMPKIDMVLTIKEWHIHMIILSHTPYHYTTFPVHGRIAFHRAGRTRNYRP